jgi:hypothetical protein
MARHLSPCALLIVGILVSRGTTESQLKKPLDPNLAQTNYSFQVRPGADSLSLHVELDATSTVTGVSVFHEGQRIPFQTLSSCNKDLPMRLLEGDEKLALVMSADFNFDGYEDLKLLQYVNDHLGKSLFCVYLWDDKAGRFRYEPQLFIADPIPHPETRTITSHSDYQGGPFTDSTYEWHGTKLVLLAESGMTYGSKDAKCAFTNFCRKLVNGKMRTMVEKPTACSGEPMDAVDCPASASGQSPLGRTICLIRTPGAAGAGFAPGSFDFSSIISLLRGRHRLDEREGFDGWLIP